MLTKIYHKKNEKFEVEFFKDRKCSEAFDFKNLENLYIELKDGDVTPLCMLEAYVSKDANIFIAYFPEYNGDSQRLLRINTSDLNIKLLCSNIELVREGFKNITPTLSQYTPEDNAVLFLSEEDKDKNVDFYERNVCCFSLKDLETWELKYLNNFGEMESVKKLTIFTPELTSQNIQQINDIAENLKRQGVEEVNVFALHCFIENLQTYTGEICSVDFAHAVRLCDYKRVKVDDAMAEIANNLHKYLYVYNVTQSEGVISRFEEFSEDSLESYVRLERLRMQYTEDFAIMPNHIKIKILDDIKESLQKYQTYLEHQDHRVEFFERKQYLSEALYFYKGGIFNKIITTNSTGILTPQNTERLQVIDCYDIFNDFLSTTN